MEEAEQKAFIEKAFIYFNTHISVISAGRLSGMAERPLFLQSTIPSVHLQGVGQEEEVKEFAVQEPSWRGTPAHCSCFFFNSTILLPASE